MDRRAIFFLGAAVVCALLVPFTGADHRWLAIALSATYLLLALASYLDFRTRRSSLAERTPPSSTPSPPDRVLTRTGG